MVSTPTPASLASTPMVRRFMSFSWGAAMGRDAGVRILIRSQSTPRRDLSRAGTTKPATVPAWFSSPRHARQHLDTTRRLGAQAHDQARLRHEGGPEGMIPVPAMDVLNVRGSKPAVEAVRREPIVARYSDRPVEQAEAQSNLLVAAFPPVKTRVHREPDPACGAGMFAADAGMMDARDERQRRADGELDTPREIPAPEHPVVHQRLGGHHGDPAGEKAVGAGGGRRGLFARNRSPAPAQEERDGACKRGRA